jgi:hypothetical protein
MDTAIKEKPKEDLIKKIFHSFGFRTHEEVVDQVVAELRTLQENNNVIDRTLVSLGQFPPPTRRPELE